MSEEKQSKPKEANREEIKAPESEAISIDSPKAGIISKWLTQKEIKHINKWSKNR